MIPPTAAAWKSATGGQAARKAEVGAGAEGEWQEKQVSPPWPLATLIPHCLFPWSLPHLTGWYIEGMGQNTDHYCPPSAACSKFANGY